VGVYAKQVLPHIIDLAMRNKETARPACCLDSSGTWRGAGIRNWLRTEPAFLFA
jgi:hypothetical protein